MGGGGGYARLSEECCRDLIRQKKCGVNGIKWTRKPSPLGLGLTRVPPARTPLDERQCPPLARLPPDGVTGEPPIGTI